MSAREREYDWEARGDAMHFDHASIGVIPRRARDAVRAYNDKRAEMYQIAARISSRSSTADARWPRS